MTTITDRVSAGNHDCYDTDDGGFPGFDDTGILYFGDNGARENQMGLIWDGVDIPSGATIDTGTYIELTDVSFGSGGTCSMDVYGVEEATLTVWSVSDDIESRTLTTANVTWSDTWGSGAAFQSPDVDTEIQEIVDTVGAVTDLTMALKDTASGTTTRDVESYDSTTGEAPYINIEYTSGTTNVNLAGAQPAPSGSIDPEQDLLRSLAGSQPAPSGSVGDLTTERNLSGDQPAASGALSGVLQSLFRSVAGSQPASTGIVAAQQTLSRSLAGSQPAASGDVSGVALVLVSVDGNQPAASGSISAQSIVAIGVSGNQPASTGALSLLASIALAGDQPAAGGEISLMVGFIGVAGDQPAGSGALAAVQSLLIGVSGNQPAGAGALTPDVIGEAVAAVIFEATARQTSFEARQRETTFEVRTP